MHERSVNGLIYEAGMPNPGGLRLDPSASLIATRAGDRNAMIKLHNLHKYYASAEQPLHVLKGVDLHIRAGELVQPWWVKRAKG